MAKSIFLFGLLLFSLACNLKEKKENAYVITDTYNDIAKKYAAIRHQGDTGPVNLTNLKDSGTAINGIKDGLWREYAIDSTQYDSSAKPPRELYIKEEIGSYIKGKRNGAWFTYVSFKNGSSFGKWGLYRECKYWNGLKDSLEVLFFTHSGDTESIRDYKQGEWEGKFIRYYRNYVVKLVGYAHKNKVRIEKSYYNDKQIRYLNTDTLINKVEHRFFRMYSDSCTLQQIGKHGNLIETAFG
jgi:antitoxin component YwqK of YwqJK toxin-antitoxin module